LYFLFFKNASTPSLAAFWSKRGLNKVLSYLSPSVIPTSSDLDTACFAIINVDSAFSEIL